MTCILSGSNAFPRHDPWRIASPGSRPLDDGLKFPREGANNTGMEAPRPKPRTIPGNCQRGFTLPEVLTVIVLMGVIFAIASSTWSGLIESRRVTGATNQLMADMRLAHTSATNQLSSWRIVLVPNRGAESVGPDYYLVKMDALGAVVPASTVSRTLPDNTRVVQGVDFPPALNDSGFGTLYDSLSLGGAATRSLEFKPDGSMNIFAPSGTINRNRAAVTQDGNPQGVVEFVESTSRIKVVG